MSFDMHDGWQGLCQVVSGGQTGADQGGLMAAWRNGIKTGGVAPHNYNTTGGPCPLLEAFGLTTKGDYRVRTAMNLSHSDATIILTVEPNEPGSSLTRRLCHEYGKPVLDVDLTPVVAALATPGDAGAFDEQALIAPIIAFILRHRPTILNVAGNREKSASGYTFHATDALLTVAFRELKRQGHAHEHKLLPYE